MMIFRILCGEWVEPLWDCMRAEKKDVSASGVYNILLCYENNFVTSKLLLTNIQNLPGFTQHFKYSYLCRSIFTAEGNMMWILFPVSHQYLKKISVQNCFVSVTVCGHVAYFIESKVIYFSSDTRW